MVLAYHKWQIVEEIVTLSKVQTSVRCEKPTKIVLQPNGEELPFTYENGWLTFEIKDVNCYAIIEII